MTSIPLFDTNTAQIIGNCLRAAATGPFFPDWEFETLIGCPRDRVQTLAEQWPLIREDDAAAIIQSILGNLLYYPHNQFEAWTELISFTQSEVEHVFRLFVDLHPS